MLISSNVGKYKKIKNGQLLVAKGLLFSLINYGNCHSNDGEILMFLGWCMSHATNNIVNDASCSRSFKVLSTKHGICYTFFCDDLT
jgi:hypothetical protein